MGLRKYSSDSSVVERVKALRERDKILRERVDHLFSMIIKSQEQTCPLLLLRRFLIHFGELCFGKYVQFFDADLGT